MKRIFTYILWIAVIVLLIAAGAWLFQRFRGSTPPVVEIDKKAIITCTPDCISYGQCGTTMNDDKLLVILAGSEPKLHEHDRYYYSDIEVLVTESTTGTMAYLQLPEKTETGQQGEVKLWRVQTSNTAEPPSWIAEWCVQPLVTE